MRKQKKQKNTIIVIKEKNFLHAVLSFNSPPCICTEHFYHIVFERGKLAYILLVIPG